MNQLSPNNDEIDLRELWQTLVRRKITIIVTALLMTVGAAVYVMTTTPVYSGNVLVEVGEVVNGDQPRTIFNLDNVNNLKEVTVASTGTNIAIPNGTTNILQISMESTDKAEIKSKLDAAVQFVLARHQEKVNLYQNGDAKVRMTQVVGEVQIGNDPIKPKKGLIIIVGFVSGLMLGILIAFFREFMANSRTDKML